MIISNVLVLQILTLVMVLRLHKLLSKDEVYFSESEGETDYGRQTIENQDAVAFEPSLFTNLMIHP